MMVGRELEAVFPKREVEIGETVLELRGVSLRERGVEDISLTVRRGEILGVAGLVEAGRTYLARALFGIEPADGGEILLRGKPLNLREPAQAIPNGLAFAPEDRRRHGVVLDLAVSSNISLASLDKLSAFGALDFKRERALAEVYTQRLEIKTPSVFAPVGTLSGGNQQKVALSRWLETKPSVLILDEPT
jgi:rhamnose transport system ATP-binding protein